MHCIFIYFAVPIELSASTFCLWTKVHVQHKLGWTQIPMAGASLRDTVWFRYCCSVTQSCQTLWDPMDCSTPGFLSFTISWSWLKLRSIDSVMPSSHLILCRPLLLLPSIFPSIRVFPNESAFPIRWQKHQSTSPSSEYSGLISFRIDSVWCFCFSCSVDLYLFFFFQRVR